MNQVAEINVPNEADLHPSGWQQVLLDTVAKRGSGHTPDKKHPEYWGGPIKWISLQDSAQLDSLYIDDTAATITAEGINNSSAVLHPKGTVVLSRDAGVGKSAIMSDDMAVSQHFMAWTCSQRLDNHFLYYWLQSKKSEFERIANGNTIKTIGLPYFKELTIPLPKADEQKRIASALSDMDALIIGLDRLISKKRDIQQATMQQLVTGQCRLPGFSGVWEIKQLGDIVELIMGQSPSSSNYNRHGDGLPLIQGNADIADRITIKRIFTTELTKLGKCGDILLSVRAPVGEVARAAFDVCLGRGVCAIRGGSEFLYHYLISIESSWARLSKGSTFDSINSAELRTLELRLPPSQEEQSAIATILSDMDSELAALETRRDKARQLKQGMMQELLTGRIRLV